MELHELKELMRELTQPYQDEPMTEKLKEFFQSLKPTTSPTKSQNI